mmetsp:Transcript_27363/g.87676  ORF Transcript_27363/g.87676 Transcript_27363/m.87676 type:complete len:505 (+) Transcript_27363:255-1769(+)
MVRFTPSPPEFSANNHMKLKSTSPIHSNKRPTRQPAPALGGVVGGEAVLVHHVLLAAEVLAGPHQHVDVDLGNVARHLLREVPAHQLGCRLHELLPRQVHKLGALGRPSLLHRPVPDVVVVHTTLERAVEVHALVGELVHEVPAHLPRDIVLPEHPLHHVDDVVPAGVPEELLHAPVAHQGGVQRREVVARDDDGHAAEHVVDEIPLPHAAARGVVAQVHQGALHDLVVHSALRVLEAPHARVEVVDDQCAQLALHLDHAGRRAVPVPDDQPRPPCLLALQLPGAHDHRVRPHPVHDQLCLEGFAHPLAAPHAQDQRGDGVSREGAGVVKDVLHYMHHHRVHKLRADVVVVAQELQLGHLGLAEDPRRDVRVYAHERPHKLVVDQPLARPHGGAAALVGIAELKEKVLPLPALVSRLHGPHGVRHPRGLEVECLPAHRADLLLLLLLLRFLLLPPFCYLLLLLLPLHLLDTPLPLLRVCLGLGILALLVGEAGLDPLNSRHGII